MAEKKTQKEIKEQKALDKKIQEALDFLADNQIILKKPGKKSATDIKREIRMAKALLVKKNYNIQGENEYTCSACGSSKSVKEGNFYISRSKLNKATGLMHTCKKCIEMYYNDYMAQNAGDIKKSFYLLCRDLDVVFSHSAVGMAIENKNTTWKTYFAKVNTLRQFDELTFKDSDPYESTASEIKEQKEIESGKLRLNTREKQARKDIIESIGRDPFENLSLRDQKALYPELVEYLDEDTQENPFLVGQIIQVVNNNHTISKLNENLSNLTRDISQLTKNDDKVKVLIHNISTLSKATTTVAKENGIAKKGGESKKRSSLTGMMNYYRTLDLEEVEQDYYSQMMSFGMQRASDISMKAIFEQGLFNDTEYEEILRESHNMVKKLEKEVLELKEERRQILIELKEEKDK